MASLLLWWSSPGCTLTPSYGCGCSGTDVSWLELCPCNQNEGKAIGILQKAAQFCLWCHQLMLKMVMEVNGQIFRGRVREFVVGIEARSHPSVGLSLDLHTSAPSYSLLWICRHPLIPAGAGINQGMCRFILFGAHSVSAWSRVSLVLPWLWL